MAPALRVVGNGHGEKEAPDVKVLKDEAVLALRRFERAMLLERLDGNETYPHAYGPVESLRGLLADYC